MMHSVLHMRTCAGIGAYKRSVLVLLLVPVNGRAVARATFRFQHRTTSSEKKPLNI